MKELEEINCEIRRIVDLRLSVSNRLRNLETEEHGQSAISQEYDNISNYHGGFLHNTTYAWLSYGCHFVVFNVKIGETISSWTFCGIVTSVSQFPTQSGDLPLLLVGIDNNASKAKDSSGLLCIFDCTMSRVLRAIRMPFGIEQVCVVSGGAEWEEFNDKRPDNVLNEMDGIACVVLRNLHHIMIDLQRSTWDVHNLSVIMDESSPAEIDLLSTKQVIVSSRSSQKKHIAYNLLNSYIEKHILFDREEFELSPLFGENLTTTIVSSTKIGCLISGCRGRIIIWQNDGSVGWISAPINKNMTVTHLALLEPTDDPRPFYYMWAVFQDESLSKTPPVLRMYAMLFERKYCNRGMNLYFNLEADPSLKFEFELNEGDRVIDLCTIERESNPDQTESGVKKGEDNLLFIATNERILLFDLNQWYKEQMPRTIEECQNPNSILAIYRVVKSYLSQPVDDQAVSFAYIPLSLQEFPSNGPSSPEELFYPNSLSLEWVELSSTKLTYWITRGIQADLLREMITTGPIILIQPSEMFHRCLSVGLMPFNSEFSFLSDQSAQREMLLSLCLEQRWSTFLVKCAVDWSDGSASYLYPTFLKWGVQRASAIKVLADRLCVPLFDQSGNGIGEADVKTLRFCSQQLECLSNVVAKLPVTADLTKQRRTLKRVSTYFQVLLWFYDVGLLPETQELEEEGTLPISLTLKVPYPYEKLSALYKEKRAQNQANRKNDKNEEEYLFIDELITRECPVLKGQWEREGDAGVTGGFYPPPSLQSLLRSYLTDCRQLTEYHEISFKHQITIYLLMDLAMLLQRLYPGVDQLIKYPSAFKMSPSLIKLTQAFWLLDHEDYEGFLDMMTGQLVSDSDVSDWHHRLILHTLIRNNQHKLALVYLRVRKPPLLSIEEQGVAVSLSVEHGLVQSAFHRRPPCHYEQLLTCFFHACKKYGKLDEILHLALDSEEEEVFVKFLEENKTEDLRLLYYLQRCRYTEAISKGNNCYSTMVSRNQSSNTKETQFGSTLGMLGAYNTTLPDITKRFSANVAASNADMELETHYPRPMSHCKSHDRLRGIYETVVAKARETYLRGEKCQIPFVTTPCMSLKFNDHDANVNCVLFPALLRKNHSNNKRRMNQIYEDEKDIADCAKRRKLSDGNISPNRSSEIKESGLAFATFDTPLVKRKFTASANKNVATETPQSILKIRHLIRSSVSPNVASSFQTKDVDNESLSNETEKKVNRQIRFDISQSKRTLMYENENEEEQEESEEEKEKRRQEEEEGKKDNENNDEANVSNESDDVFLSPDTSIKSYSESAVLSGDSSSNSSRSYCYARPRPSLRRSALQSSLESLQKSRANTKRVSGNVSVNSSVNTSPISSEVVDRSVAFVVNTLEKHSSLLSTSIYSTTLLSSNSSVEISGYSSRELERISPQPRQSSIVGNRKNKFTVSSTPLTKSIIFKTRINEKQMVDMDDDDKTNFGSDSPIAKEAKAEFDVPSESKKSLNIEQPDYFTSDYFAKRREGNLEDNAQSDNQQSENKYNNGNIMRRTLDNPYEIQYIIAESEKTAESIILDESDEELLRLQNDTEDDDDEHEEAFKSISATLENTQTQLESNISIPRLTEIGNPECRINEEYDIDRKSNGLSDSICVTDNIDFTDDKSVSSQNTTPMVETGEPDEIEKEKETYSILSAHSENVLCDFLNITDDESDSNIKEIVEKSVKRNKKSSNSSEQYVTKRNVDEMERNVESDEKSHKSDKQESMLPKCVDEFSSRPDVKSQEVLLSETTSSTKLKKSQVESEDDQPARMTRSRRAGSIAKDQAANVSSLSSSLSRRVKADRIMHIQQENSKEKDTTQPSDSQNINTGIQLSSRTRRGCLATKNSLTNSSSRDAEEPPLLQKVTSSVYDSLSTSPSSQETDCEKPPRLRRASSASKDVHLISVDEMFPSVQTRSRRANSLAKDMTSTTAIDEDLVKSAISSSQLAGFVEVPTSSIRRSRKPISMVKEILEIEVQDSDTESVKDDTPLRRSTRLISSAKKELQLDATKTLSKSKSASSLSKLINDDIENNGAKKRPTRAKKSSVSSNTDKILTTTTNKSSLKSTDKEERLEEVRATRANRRGSSVPKEITMQTGRKCKFGSVTKEIIPEDAEVPPDTQETLRKLRSSVVKNIEDVSNIDSPVVNRRGRSASIQSVPEEFEEILSRSSKETKPTTRKGTPTTRGNARGRRASSADVLHQEVKKRFRSTRATSIAAESIAEETALECENKIILRHENEGKTEEITECSHATRRRRAASTTTYEDMRKDVAKKHGKMRQTNVNQENSNLFSFSQPEKADDAPSDEKDIGEVPTYVFSPPQTRSKNISLNQHRRKMSSFIPSLYQQGEQHPTVQKPHDIAESGSYTRVTVNTYGSRFRTKFVISKKPKNVKK